VIKLKAPVVTLRPVDRFNWKECAALSVRNDQSSMVGPNVRSLAEAHVRPESSPRAVYTTDGQMVGFVMYLRDLADGHYYIHRIMIDHRRQRAGYGYAALAAAIGEISRQPDYQNPVHLLFLLENADAERFYRRFGFEDTGRIIVDEKLFTIRSNLITDYGS